MKFHESPQSGKFTCDSRNAPVSTKPAEETSDDEYFVTICLSSDGLPQIKSSASLRLFKDHIVGGALTRFLECISQATTQTPGLHGDCTNNYIQPKQRTIRLLLKLS